MQAPKPIGTSFTPALIRFVAENKYRWLRHTLFILLGLILPPFIFIPFVENAIKHGASSVGHSWLKLDFRLAEKQLHFYAENSKPPVKKNTIGGLGLGNIKRRLQLLYPGNHTLEIRDAAHTYTVNLILPL